MARESSDFLKAWASLDGDESEPGWQVIDLAAAGPIDVRAGRRSPDNAEAVLVAFPTAKLAKADRLPDGQGFAVERVDPNSSGVMWLALSRKFAGNAEVFAELACNVVGALDEAASAGCDEAKLLRVFIGRVAAWQEFMRKGTRALSAEAEIGLIGELEVLRAVIKAGVVSSLAMEAWLGPLDGLQDFEIGTGALEVKATVATSGFPAKIGSLGQLDDSIRQPLFVAGARLREIDGGRGLPQAVEAMRAAIKGEAESERLFADRLLAAGYFDSHANLYPRRFELASMRVIEVGEGFPRLTLGSAPIGVMKAMYEIDLDKAPGENVGIEAALQKLGVI